MATTSGASDLARDDRSQRSFYTNVESRMPDINMPKSAKLRKPKRPMTAYNFFFRDQHRKMVKETPDQSSNEMKQEGSDESINSDSEGSSFSHESAAEKRGKKRNSEESDESSNSDSERSSSSCGSRKRAKKRTGVVSFLDLGKVIGKRWKELGGDELSRYKGMAEKDSKRYKMAIEQYYKDEIAALCRQGEEASEEDAKKNPFSLHLLSETTTQNSVVSSAETLMEPSQECSNSMNSPHIAGIPDSQHSPFSQLPLQQAHANHPYVHQPTTQIPSAGQMSLHLPTVSNPHLHQPHTQQSWLQQPNLHQLAAAQHAHQGDIVTATAPLLNLLQGGQALSTQFRATSPFVAGNHNQASLALQPQVMDMLDNSVTLARALLLLEGVRQLGLRQLQQTANQFNTQHS